MLKKIDFRQFFIGPLRSSIWGVFFLVIISTLVFMISSFAIKKDSEVRLQREFSRIEDQITNRMQTYANSMLAIRSYLYNLRGINQQQFNRYVEDLQLFERYPGMKGIGYAEVLSRSELTENAYRLSQLVTNFSPDQYSRTSDYYAIATSIYPEDLLNQKVLGSDMFAETNRKNALSRAIKVDKPSLSGVVRLLQDKDDPNNPTGLMLFFPVYKQSDPRIEHAVQNTSGALFISLRALDFFSAVFGDQSLDKEKVGFSIDLLWQVGDHVRLYERFERKSSNKMALTKTIDLFGQTVNLSVYPLQTFFTPFDLLFPYVLCFLTMLVCALIFLNIRNNSTYADELGKTNTLLGLTLQKQEEKQEDLIILNRTLQKMSHTLDTDKIVESFIQGVSDIFESKGKFAIYSTSKASEAVDSIHCQLISSNDDAFFKPKANISRKIYGQIFSTRNQDEFAQLSANLDFLIIDPQKSYKGMCSKIEAPVLGVNAFAVFIGTSNEIEESESVLFEALMKHFNTSIQNSQLLKKVEDANQSKSAFLANMSHEIRTPLNALMGFSEMLIRDDVDRNQKSELSSNIIRNGQLLTRLVDDILDLSKIEAGKLYIEKKRSDVFEMVSEIKSMMKMRLDHNELEFKTEFDGKIPQFVEIDPIRLKQILTNLIGNSIKFTEKGMVRLRISCQTRDDKKNILIFRVEDTGSGMDRDFRTKLFLPFSQADNTSTRRYGGSGLGLAISKRLATEMGGDLELVFSERDIGSIFELCIPVDVMADQVWTENPEVREKTQKKSKDANVAHLQSKKILLVEDSPDNQDFFNFFLTRAGGDVKIVSNGIDAVTEATKNTYDIILMDIQIPGIDGKEATRRIRKHGFGGPIVALTAHAMQEEQRSCINAGCNGQISKPVSGDVLVTQVSEFIRGQYATA
jgi:signal transduction histidine kinase/CHASE1-domain containing sensor protein/ActR/RegA family two-component response regulator